MGKKRAASSGVKDVHKQSLSEQLQDPETFGVRAKARPSKKSKRNADADEEDAAVRPEQSSIILNLAREQQQEEERERAKTAMGGTDVGLLLGSAKRAATAGGSDDDDDDEWEVGDDDFDDVHDLYADDADHFTQDDEDAFNAFMQKDAGGGGLLSDLIAAKLKEASARREGPDGADDGGAGLEERRGGIDEKMETVYTDIGRLLSRYTTGKLPKAFKVIPHLQNWEEVVFMTDPERWSPHATYAATKMFVSNLNTKQTQRFLNLILLNKVRDDIRQNRRLHFALFQAVKKAVFKPGAFYKGLVLPLLQAGNCTLREAVIFSSVLTRVSIPVDHSSAALLRMADMPYSGVTSFFIKTLLDKKYSLPYRVIDALVDHFVSFRAEERSLPVIWHLCLLTFVQRYKHEIRAEEKDLIRALLKEQVHSQVTPEIHRELNHGRNRGERSTDGGAMDAQIIPSTAVEDPFKMAHVIMEEFD